MSYQKLLIRQVTVLDPLTNFNQIADVFIEQGYIQTIAPQIQNIAPETEVINGEGLILAPGLVDLYSHSGEPGYEQRETFLSLSKAAQVGGFTRINILPTTKPTLDNATVLASLPTPAHCNIKFWGALTLQVKGTQMTELANMADLVVGFADGYAIQDFGLLRQLLEYLKPLNKPIALVASYHQLQNAGVMREGSNSLRFGLPGNPVATETAYLAALLEIIATINTPVHIMRLSTARGVDLLAQAKQRGLPVSASTTWLHLLLTSEDLGNYNPNLRLEPPVGNEQDRAALIAALSQGVIDAIAIDHTPYTYEEKTVAFAEAPPGAIGLELALPLLWQRFVASGDWCPLKLWHLLSNGPLQCLQQQPLSCAAGQPAELVLFDPQHTWRVEPSNLQSLSYNTSYLNQTIKGKVIKTIIGGQY